LILYIESAWKVFTDTSIPSARTYLFVHHPGDESQNRLFTSDGKSHAEQNFIVDFEKDNKERHGAGGKQVKLDVYITHPINCAGQLKAFAEEYSFHLNIVVGACHDKEKELCKLMKVKEKKLQELMKEKEKELCKLMKEKEEELCELMTSGYCTVRSFTKDDYGDLARYLHFPIIREATIVLRDMKTKEKLRKIQDSECN